VAWFNRARFIQLVTEGAQEPNMSKLFGQFVRTVVNVALLPIDAVKDIVTAPLDVTLSTDRRVGSRISERIEKLKDEAGDD
jgi:hypothetical protein